MFPSAAAYAKCPYISCSLGKVSFHQLQSRKSVLPSAAVWESVLPSAAVWVKRISISCRLRKVSFHQLQSRKSAFHQLQSGQGTFISSDFLLSANAKRLFYCFLLSYTEIWFTPSMKLSAHRIIGISLCIKIRSIHRQSQSLSHWFLHPNADIQRKAKKGTISDRTRHV